ncbi:MAG: hypothetical protein ACI9WU_004340, partial [Myxococcota bacterium]
MGFTGYGSTESGQKRENSEDLLLVDNDLDVSVL